MGLEPTTFCVQSRRSSQLSYVPGLSILPGAGSSGAAEGLAVRHRRRPHYAGEVLTQRRC
jgi:hypothetical protein